MRWLGCTFLHALLLSIRLTAADAPHIVWASDPVQPDETVLLTGEFAANPVVEISHLLDSESPSPAFIYGGSKIWHRVVPLQSGSQSVKFVLPAEEKPGIFDCRVLCGEQGSNTVRFNTPAAWWVQGDHGTSASPGGWVRVLGKCLHFSGRSSIQLQSPGNPWLALDTVAADGFSLRAQLPATLKPGIYQVAIHNGFGGPAGWSRAGEFEIKAADPWPETVFDVLDFYGANRERELQRTIRRGSKPVDRTEAIDAALAKAQEKGGGVVFFPEGTYAYRGEMKVPPHTLVKGEGMGLVCLWWGTGQFALDGGGSQERFRQPGDAGLPPTLISGHHFGLENLSLYIPLECNLAINAGDGFRMNRVRVRVDRYWGRTPERQNGNLIRLKSDFAITDCDILAKASALTFGKDGIVSGNKILSGKCNVELAHSSGVIVEDNEFISIDPTTYINVYEEGRNIYYARNRHESQYVHQSDYSFTFDGPGGAYLGKIESCAGTTVNLSADPVYPKWAGETSSLWKRSALCILSGKGAGQYRFITSNQAKVWTIEQPFDVLPDAASIVTITPYRGRLLVIGNRFEDASWVNMGYGSSFDVICSGNSLFRCGEFLNYGLNLENSRQPSWYVQYLNNDIFEGHTLVITLGKEAKDASGITVDPITRATIHRGQHLHADNSGSIQIEGHVPDCIVEHCRLENPRSTIKSEGRPENMLFRNNTSAGGYQGKSIKEVLVVDTVPPLP